MPLRLLLLLALAAGPARAGPVTVTIGPETWNFDDAEVEQCAMSGDGAASLIEVSALGAEGTRLYMEWPGDNTDLARAELTPGTGGSLAFWSADNASSSASPEHLALDRHQGLQAAFSGTFTLRGTQDDGTAEGRIEIDCE